MSTFRILKLILAALVLSIVYTSDARADYSSPAFNFIDYLAANPDLPAAGITTEHAAYKHWIRHGRQECRRSTSSFHPAQYLSFYPDLQNAFGENCSAAVDHWLRHGFYEGRIAIGRNQNFGSVINGDVVIGNEVMTIGASRRTAGAIDSLMSRNKQFINAYDHGRQISIAWRNDTSVMGECDNPTEPGSEDDGTAYDSTTEILALNANMNGTLYSKVMPAFWTNPSQTTPDSCTRGPRNDGRYRANDQILEKLVQVGYKGDPNVIVFDILLHNNRTDVPNFQIEAPTGYLTHEFTRFLKQHPNGNLEDIDMRAWRSNSYGNATFYGGEQTDPGIVSTPDGQYAMGAYSPPQNGVAPVYALYQFPHSIPQVATNKWAIVFRLGKLRIQTYRFRSYIVVGTVEDVRQRLQWLRSGW